MRDEKIGFEPAGNIQHLRAEFDARRRHREGPQFETLLLREVFEDDNRFLAGRVVVKQIADLLAAQVVAKLLLGEGDRRRTL